MNDCDEPGHITCYGCLRCYTCGNCTCIPAP